VSNNSREQAMMDTERNAKREIREEWLTTIIPYIVRLDDPDVSGEANLAYVRTTLLTVQTAER